MSPLVRRFTRALFLAGLLTTLQALPGAAAAPCEFLRDDGSFRECTFTEKYGKCLVTALESYEDCVQGSDGIVHRLVCELAVQVDMMACHLGMVGEAGKLVTPV
jgi:hypothetical protein